MPRPRLLVGLDAPPPPRSPQAGRLRALARKCDLVLCTASPRAGASMGARSASPPAEVFRIALARAAAVEKAEAAVLLDGPAVRAALRPGRFDHGTRVVLWADADTQTADAARAARLADAAHNPRPWPWPDELWWTGPHRESSPREFLPRAFRELDESSAGGLAARLAASGRPRRPALRGLTTIVIPCWNGLTDTRLCLDALLKHTQAPFEVIVVDNGSKDGTARHVRSLGDPRVRLIVHETNLGFARAVNRGLAAARGPYAVWLNNDCIVTPGWLELLQDALERAPWIGAVGPRTDGASGLQHAGVKAPDPRRLPQFAAAWSLRWPERMTWAHRLVGFCLLHRTELLRRIGFLDERFGLGCFEDFDWCLRARQAGYEFYVADDVFVAHREHAAFHGNNVRYAQTLHANRAAFVEKWCRRGLEFLDQLDDALQIERLKKRRR